MFTHRNDVQAKSRRFSRDLSPNAAHPNQSHCRTGNLTRARAFVPDGLLPPNSLLLKEDRLWNLFCQRESAKR